MCSEQSTDRMGWDPIYIPSAASITFLFSYANDRRHLLFRYGRHHDAVAGHGTHFRRCRENPEREGEWIASAARLEVAEEGSEDHWGQDQGERSRDDGERSP